MICQNCGAAYGEEELQCPYCQSENRTAAERQKKQVLAAYDLEEQKLRKEMKSYAKNRAGILTKRILWGVLLLFGIAVLVAAGVILFGKLQAGHSYQREQAHLEKLEAMYGQQDYAGIADYVRKHELWSASYKKYEQIYELQYHYQRLKDAMCQLEELSAADFSSEEKRLSCLETWASSAAKDAAALLASAREYAEDQAILGNESCMEDYGQACSRLLLELGCTEEEIRQAADAAESGETVLENRILRFYTEEKAE